MPTPRVTIDALPEQATPEDGNFLVVQDDDTTKKMSIATLKTIESTALAAHLSDTSDAHDASAISTTDSGSGIDSTTVQGQLGQLAGVAGSATTNLAAHLADPTDAHDATAISAAPHAGVTSTHVQGQLEELSTALAVKDVVWVGPDAPVDPVVEMWWDSNEPSAYMPAAIEYASDAETIAGTSTTKVVTPAGLNAALPVVDVRQFGAVGDGIVDDSAAIQAAIDYCVGGTVAAGASTIRVARAALHLPAGTYRTTVAPRVVSVMGFHMYGDSMYSTKIQVSGARTYGIDLDGLMCCDIHDFQIKGTWGAASTDTVRDGLALNWTAAAARSTSGNRFARIIVHELKFTNGMTFGLDTAERQVDDTWVHACLIGGQWTVGETTWWQRGFCSGNGVHGNVVNHNYYSCSAALNRWNVHANAVNVLWEGGDIGNSEVDFRHTGAMPLVINGLRSEGAQRFYESDGGANYPSSAHISNITFTTNLIAADLRFIKIQYSGTYYLENICLDQNALYPHILVTNTGTGPTYVTAIGCQSRSQVNQFFEQVGTTPKFITNIGYCQIDASGIPMLNVLNSSIRTEGTNGGGIVDFNQARLSGATLALGDATTAQESVVAFNSPNTQANKIEFKRGGTSAWWFYDAASTQFFFRDMINANMHMSFVAGTAATGRVDIGTRFTVPAATGIMLGASGGPKWTSGTGTPEGVVSAEQGSLFSRTDGGATTLYVKQTGGGAATGWVAK